MAQEKVAQLKAGELFDGILWLVSGTVRQTKAGEPYWEGSLQDATGSVTAKLWNNAEGQKDRVRLLQQVLRPGPVLIRARVDLYQGNLQLNILGAEPVLAEEADPALFAPASRRTREEMLGEFEEIVGGVRDGDYKRLLKTFRHDRETFALYASAPAAKAIHHAWVGGLLEHSLSLARGVLALAPNYPALDTDLLLCGCFLHDCGKALEISAAPGFDYTVDGKLMGHIYMGARFAEHLCDRLKAFPEEKRRRLLHLILSHQGEREEGYGSPVDPVTPEAIFFHHLDNLDAKVQSCLTSLENAEKSGDAGPFTAPKASPLRKGYYRGGEGGEGGATEEQPDEEAAPPAGDGQPTLW